MHRLIERRVCKWAAVAALVSTICCYPRFALWSQRIYPTWYLAATVFCVGFILWAFVFAWHTDYTGRPVFTVEIEPRAWVWAGAAGLILAIVLHYAFDPQFRRTTPEDYPMTFAQWTAMTLFSLGFNQLFLVFAPFAWLMRLLNRKTMAVVLTAVFGVAVLLLKTRLALPTPLLLMFILVRVLLGLLAVAFYLRGGVLLASSFGLLVQSRHLLGPPPE